MKKNFLALLFIIIFINTKNVYATTYLASDYGDKYNYTDTETISGNSNSTRTKEEITKKYKDLLPTFDYSNSIYESAPVTTAPYYEGKLKSAVVSDGLNRINYYRWLYGISSLEINEDKMSRSQKGALILDINDELTHTPSQPEGMDDDFYNEAYLGTYARFSTTDNDIYSGNVSWGSKFIDIFSGYVSDDSNTVSASIGHRLSMFDLYGKKISFGYSGLYSAVSVYKDWNNYNVGTNTEKFYSWPSSGYFPIEEISTDIYWHMSIGSYAIDSKTNIVFTYDGEEYKVDSSNIYYDTSYGAIYYNLPEELLEKVVDRYSRFKTNVNIGVKANNLYDKTNEKVVNIDYETKFFAVNPINITGFTSYYKTDNDSYYQTLSTTSENKITTSGTTLKILTYLTPYNATEYNFELSSSDESILKSDGNGTSYTILKSGKVTITIKDTLTNVSNTYSLNIVVPSTSMNITNKNISLLKGTTEKINVSLLPTNTSDISTYTFTSSDNSIATVDSNGVVTAVKEGNVTITVKSSLGYTDTVSVEVYDYVLGDVDRSGKISLSDCISLLKIYLKGGYDVVGDIDKNSSISLTDVIMLLKLYLNS